MQSPNKKGKIKRYSSVSKCSVMRSRVDLIWKLSLLELKIQVCKFHTSQLVFFETMNILSFDNISCLIYWTPLLPSRSSETVERKKFLEPLDDPGDPVCFILESRWLPFGLPPESSKGWIQFPPKMFPDTYLRSESILGPLFFRLSQIVSSVEPYFCEGLHLAIDAI